VLARWLWFSRHVDSFRTIRPDECSQQFGHVPLLDDRPHSRLTPCSAVDVAQQIRTATNSSGIADSNLYDLDYKSRLLPQKTPRESNE
jgi:hypothetical protein